MDFCWKCLKRDLRFDPFLTFVWHVTLLLWIGNLFRHSNGAQRMRQRIDVQLGDFGVRLAAQSEISQARMQVNKMVNKMTRFICGLHRYEFGYHPQGLWRPKPSRDKSSQKQRRKKQEKVQSASGEKMTEAKTSHRQWKSVVSSSKSGLNGKFDLATLKVFTPANVSSLKPAHGEDEQHVRQDVKVNVVWNVQRDAMKRII